MRSTSRSVQLGGGDAAAVGASRAIDGCFHILGNRLEAAFNEVMSAHPRPETLVLLALLFAEAFDLHEVCEHGWSTSSIATKQIEQKMFGIGPG